MIGAECNGYLITNPANVYYLSDFTGEGNLFISDEKQYVLTDSRYTEQAEKESPGFEVVSVPIDQLQDLLPRLHRIGFESHHLSYQGYLKWQSILGDNLVAQPSLVEKLRAVKDTGEIEKIRQAVRIGDAVFDEILPQIYPGVTELALAIEIDHLLRIKGCEKESFDTIAVSGARSSLPHGIPTDKQLEVGELLTLDFGGFYQRYAGDMTRTVAVAKSCSRIRNIYSRVLEAQMEAVAAVAPGVACSEIDGVARGILKKHNLDEYFAHSTGHGVGLDIHEQPTVSRQSDTVLTENMVITIEPGVYIRGWGGVRIEDVVLVKSSGHEILTESTKDLIVTKNGGVAK